MSSNSRPIKLLGSTSSVFVIRVGIALNLKSIDYEFVEAVKLGVKSELVIRYNPIHDRVPILVVEDKPIWESLIILQYLDEEWPNTPSILPHHNLDRAISRFWASYIDEKWYPILWEIRLVEGEKAKAEAAERLVEGLVVLEMAFVELIRGEPFFGGENIGYVDMALGCFLGWLRTEEEIGRLKLLDEAKTPRLVEWAQRFCCHDAVKGVIPEREELIVIAGIAKEIIMSRKS